MSIKSSLQKLQEDKKKQESTDNFAIAMGALMGANIVKKADFDRVNQEKQQLLKKTQDIGKLKDKLILTQCKLYGFVNYHSQWKPTTRKFEKKLKKLENENLYIDFSQFPTDISDNLKEAYNCYLNGLSMACYIMTLRTIELIVNMLYHENTEVQYDSNGKPKFVNASTKLQWVKTNKMIGGADYTMAKAFIEARNDSVHEVYTPTEKQLLSAFETTITLVNQLKLNVKPNQN